MFHPHRPGSVFGLSAALVILMAAPRAGALEPGSAIDQFERHGWQAKDGLPSNVVRAIAQDRDGYLWLGTREGVVRFDGFQLTVVGQGGAARLPAEEVLALAPAADGSVWIGYDGAGLARLRGDQVRTWTARDGLPHDFVRALLPTRDGGVWVGTPQGFAHVGADDRVDRVLHGPDGGPLRVRTLAEGPDGRIWIGGVGLHVWNGRQLATAGAGTMLERQTVLSLAIAPDGTVRVGTADAGLFTLRAGEVTEQLTKAGGLPSDSVSALWRERNGVLWIGTYRGGLSRLIDGALETLTTGSGFPDDRVLAVRGDREGNLWVGTRSAGLVRLRDRAYRLIGDRDGMPAGTISAVAAAPDGSVWVAPSEGPLARHAAGRVQTYQRPAMMPQGEGIVSLAPARAGGVWVVLSGGGLWHWPPGGQASLVQAPATTRFRQATEDAQGRLWAAAPEGVYRRDGAALALVPGSEALGGIRIVHPGRGGTTWIGFRRHVARLQGEPGGRLTTFLSPADDRLGDVAALYDDAEGVLWISTRQNGLERLAAERVTVVTTRAGLPSDRLYGLVEDGRGRIWCNAGTGVFHADRTELADVAAGRRTHVDVIHYGAMDGIRTDAAGWPAATRATDGRLWFATAVGAVVFDPARVPSLAPPPKPIIEGLLVDGQEVSLAAATAVPPSRGNVEIRFTSPFLSAPEKLRFRYRLLGFDAAWADAGKFRSARYASLPWGRYRFEVAASRSPGSWSQTATAATFTLTPPFHRSVPFYGLCGFLVLAGLFGAYRLRVSRLRGRLAATLDERTRIARDMHDTLAQTFTALSMQIECTRRILASAGSDAEPQRQHVDRLRDLTTSGLGELRRAVLSLRPQPLARGSLVSALREIAGELGDRTIAVSVRGRERRLAPGTEEALLRMAQEGMTNAVRHAGARRILLQITYRWHRTILIVHDDGRGFDPHGGAPDGERHGGLVGMRERAAAVGAKLEWQSAGSGTQIRIEVTG